MGKENAVPQADPDKSRGELTEGRTDPTEEAPAGDYETESDQLHRQKAQITQQPLGPYTRDPASGENPEVDDITKGDQAKAQRDKREQQEKAEG